MKRLFSDVAERVTDPYLVRAAVLAERASGRTWPNPVVGCVIVAGDEIVGEGFHPRAGEPHAEVFALAQAGARACGATAYVTLEPCAHHGKTPPCADALIAAGVTRVVVGMGDPHELAAGGAERLREAGIEVQFAHDPAPFWELNEGWFHRLAMGTPLVTVKSALTLDARVAFAAGERAAITGDSGATVTSRLRSSADAVLVSAATVNADDPALTVRRGAMTDPEQPLRVVLVRDVLPRPDARVFTDNEAATVVLAPHGTALPTLGPGVDALGYARDSGLEGALGVLGEHGIGELLVEPGPRLMTALWEERLVDRLVTVVAGGMGGAVAPSVFLGDADRRGAELAPQMRPLETGIVDDVSITVWVR